VSLQGNVTLGRVSVLLSSSLNPSTYASAVTFTATVSPSTAAGSVTFYDGATNLGAAPLVSGSAALTTSTLAVGAHSITAVFSASGGVSAALRQTVNSAASSVSLSSSANPSALNQSVTFTAIIAPPLCTGTVTFYNSGVSMGTGAVSGGIASFSTSWGTTGTESISASYGGDSNCGGSSATLTPAQAVRNLTVSSVTLTSNPNAWYFGQQITFTATVTPAAPNGETVTFYDTTGGVMTNIGTPNTSAGAATLTLNAGFATVAQHSVTASYPGDANLSASTSNALVQNVGPWISGLSLPQGPVQMGVVISGLGFGIVQPPGNCVTPPNSWATLSGTNANVVPNGWNPGCNGANGTVTVQVPAAASGPVDVYINNIKSNDVQFTVTNGFGCP
jgi:hypothetical protein